MWRFCVQLFEEVRGCSPPRLFRLTLTGRTQGSQLSCTLANAGFLLPLPNMAIGGEGLRRGLLCIFLSDGESRLVQGPRTPGAFSLSLCSSPLGPARWALPLILRWVPGLASLSSRHLCTCEAVLQEDLEPGAEAHLPPVPRRASAELPCLLRSGRPQPLPPSLCHQLALCPGEQPRDGHVGVAGPGPAGAGEGDGRLSRRFHLSLLALWVPEIPVHGEESDRVLAFQSRPS